ncbi:MAG: DUF4159 domain-containing protein [Desulfobacteraceae bacterium]|nr:MAG: DUF4159 domain-containing protein [Desulfobacteraceae bacterium]
MMVMISRRNFLFFTLGLAAHLSSGLKLSYGSRYPHFFFTQLKYRSEEWDPNPLFLEAIVEELELRTSIDARRERLVMEPTDPDLFFSPFLYMAGRSAFESFTRQERETLRRFLTHGGFLFAENTIGARGAGFDRSFREEMKALLPEAELKPLSRDHSVYQSFYLIEGIGGRQRVSPFLEGAVLDAWTPVIYSHNDLSGAWARDRYGKWVHECTPGGEAQREAAFKDGINIIVYSLTADYKKDVIHHPFIQKRRNV